VGRQPLRSGAVSMLYEPLSQPGSR